MSEFCSRLATHLDRLRGDRRGATAIEYALMASGISLAIISTVWSLGSAVKTNLYDKIAAFF